MIILMAELLPMLFRQWEIERYKGFLINGSAVPTFATGFDWYAQGTILRPGRLGSIVEIKRIKGPIFNSKEADGLYLPCGLETGYSMCLAIDW
jgi:hypothetical protein